MRQRTSVLRPGDTRPPRAFAAALAIGLGCAGVPDARAWVGAALLAIGIAGALAALARAALLRWRRAQAAAWQDAARVARLARAGALGELARWVDRELTAPVASASNDLGAARRMLAGGGRERLPDAIAALDEGRAEVERAVLALRQLALLLDGEARRRERLDLSAVARDAVRLVRPHASARRVAVRAALAARLPAVDGDAGQLLDVALSLLVAAVDHASTSRRRAVRVRTALGQEGVELEVGGSGAALTEVARQTLFTPFASLRPGAVGLGLVAARAIVEAHQGRLAVDRAVSGARFRIVLPAAVAAGAADAERASG